jgi:hypothetical protein
LYVPMASKMSRASRSGARDAGDAPVAAQPPAVGEQEPATTQRAH